MKNIFADIKISAIAGDIRYPMNDNRLIGTIMISTRGTNIKLAGIETRGRIPNEFVLNGNVISL